MSSGIRFRPTVIAAALVLTSGGALAQGFAPPPSPGGGGGVAPTNTAPVLVDASPVTTMVESGMSVVLPLPALASRASDDQGDELEWRFAATDDDSIETDSGTAMLLPGGIGGALAFDADAADVDGSVEILLVAREATTDDALRSAASLPVRIAIQATPAPEQEPEPEPAPEPMPEPEPEPTPEPEPAPEPAPEPVPPPATDDEPDEDGEAPAEPDPETVADAPPAAPGPVADDPVLPDMPTDEASDPADGPDPDAGPIAPPAAPGEPPDETPSDELPEDPPTAPEEPVVSEGPDASPDPSDSPQDEAPDDAGDDTSLDPPSAPGGADEPDATEAPAPVDPPSAPDSDDGVEQPDPSSIPDNVPAALGGGQGLRTVAVGSDVVVIAWDVYAGERYTLLRDGEAIASGEIGRFVDTGVVDRTHYVYELEVQAADGSVQRAVSRRRVLTGEDASAADTLVPRAPGDVRAMTLFDGRVAVAWHPGGDDTGIAGYNVYRDGRYAATVRSHAWVDDAATGALGATYEVTAFDVARNYSPLSPATFVDDLAPSIDGAAVSADVSLDEAGAFSFVPVNRSRSVVVLIGDDVAEAVWPSRLEPPGATAGQLVTRDASLEVYVLPLDRSAAASGLQLDLLGGADASSTVVFGDTTATIDPE